MSSELPLTEPDLDRLEGRMRYLFPCEGSEFGVDENGGKLITQSRTAITLAGKVSEFCDGEMAGPGAWQQRAEAAEATVAELREQVAGLEAKAKLSAGLAKAWERILNEYREAAGLQPCKSIHDGLIAYGNAMEQQSDRAEARNTEAERLLGGFQQYLDPDHLAEFRYENRKAIAAFLAPSDDQSAKEKRVCVVCLGDLDTCGHSTGPTITFDLTSFEPES